MYFTSQQIKLSWSNPNIKWAFKLDYAPHKFMWSCGVQISYFYNNCFHPQTNEQHSLHPCGPTSNFIEYHQNIVQHLQSCLEHKHQKNNLIWRLSLLRWLTWSCLKMCTGQLIHLSPLECDDGDPKPLFMSSNWRHGVTSDLGVFSLKKSWMKRWKERRRRRNLLNRWDHPKLIIIFPLFQNVWQSTFVIARALALWPWLVRWRSSLSTCSSSSSRTGSMEP